MLENNEIKLNFKIVPPNESDIFWLFYFPLKHFDELHLLKSWNQDISAIENKNREISCQAGVRACSIVYNGDVYGCDLMMDIEEFKAGNIKTQSIKDIWKSSPVFTKLRDMKTSDLSGKCNECEHSWCGGGCRSAAYNLTGSITGSDESCFLCQ